MPNRDDARQSPLPGIQVRRVRPDDRSAWLRMRRALWPHHDALDLDAELESILSDAGDQPVFVATRPEGGLCGLLEVAVRDRAAGCATRSVGYLEGWYVDPDVRRTGIGGRLVGAAEAWARDRGCREMASDTDDRYPLSRDAHEALGYRIVKQSLHFRKVLAPSLTQPLDPTADPPDSGASVPLAVGTAGTGGTVTTAGTAGTAGTRRIAGALRLSRLHADHLPLAARIFAEALAAERGTVPALPARDPSCVIELLAAVAADHPSAAAFDDGRLVGFLTGRCIDGFQGAERGVYCPEWAIGATGTHRGRILRRLYDHMAREWAGAGCANHAVTLLASDRVARDVLWWNGFGARVVDAVRDVGPIDCDVPDGVAVRRAGPDDADVLAPLAQALADHVEAAPISVHVARSRDAAFYRAWLAAAGRWAWVAEAAGTPVGFLRAETGAEDVAWVVRSPDTLAISGAYVLPDHRGRGIGPALVDAALALARREGMRACSVDFESQNDPAVRLWLRHFTPVCVSVLRRIDARTLP